MAVYTHISAERIADVLSGYDVGLLVSAKGIAEGVENSNYLVETDRNRFILTIYEKRVDESDLPFFLALLDHLAGRGIPVPPVIADRGGRQITKIEGKPACLITFVPGLSPGEPKPGHAEAAGIALGEMHGALTDFAQERSNDLSLEGWRALAERCGRSLDDIGPGLHDIVADELDWLAERWPHALPRSAIHADLFPDNVLMLGERVTGLIDFYFACTDIRAYDLAVTHGAWCFSPNGESFREEHGRALIRGYASSHPLSNEERAAMPILCRGAALRFLLTRAWDWLNTPAGALVTRKDPLAFLRRLQFYRDAGQDIFAP